MGKSNDDGKNILLLEDDPDIRIFLQTYLGAREFEVFTAGSLQEGLQLAAKHRIDWVILDHGLPDGSGLDFVRILPPGSMRAILFTGDPNFPEIDKQARALGVEACFRKSGDLFGLVRYLCGEAEGCHAAATGRDGSFSCNHLAPQIVLVDDDYFYRHLIEKDLQGRGFRVTSFADPIRALDAFVEGSGASEAVYIVDIFMEGMSGLEFMDALRERSRGRPVRAIAITGASAPFIESEALEHGASFFLRKPFCESELESMCKFLSRRAG